ncbi:threonyl-tRNA synthetase [Saprolegnia parasitica CBS 223.65]|uniref:threonine--tRNA ligase n=1 Tax=Saprolegnia parasitica (strain CBS 223.65) TaxID=695850 RepID=A0A067BJN9_SAPPC|nr:threonyl-tRNA synthetase [Saprolegnia parasitica CBS 223.65]KDO18649.1 threonyl-tRNA synthetase [Saprolegnia parasitica CBS 223.65]|eukprot:XP_012210635.1 threonyl-tRNA synthetase [Saprolegnia parasitica CBS 223.65]
MAGRCGDRPSSFLRTVRCMSHAATRLEKWNAELARQARAATGATPPATVQLVVPSVATPYSPTMAATPLQAMQQFTQATGAKIPPVVGATISTETDEQIVWDLSRPLPETTTHVALHDFDDKRMEAMFWHSSAHVLGAALEAKFGDDVLLCDGPSLPDGFFYEMYLPSGRTLSEHDFSDIEAEMAKIIKARAPFERLQVTRDVAKDMFGYSKFKLQMLNNIPADEPITLYKCGSFVDLCRGPHLPHTGMLQTVALTRCGASHWTHGSELLQRVYGVTFPDKARMKEWKHLQAEAKKRDHRIIGKAQSLFLFHPWSPGSSFMLPHGTRIFNRLASFIRHEYRKRGYDEVVTPLIFKKELWETSGHYENYKEDMYSVRPGMDDDKPMSCADHANHAALQSDDDGDLFGLKPMNCPGHCLMFKENKVYSYRELPVRFADFSALHRNEASGALTGLTRVRRFHQDDAHIFCRPDQVQDEIQSCLAFIKHVYGVFGFEFQLRLSTRPEAYMGDLTLWDSAEAQLEAALNAFDMPWTLNAGDGAFYGPKIDIAVRDALKREHQCGTIQLDFQLPLRFNLKYDGSDGNEHTPIIVHRAVLGSIERMMAILIEHTAGKWPLWLSPRQVAVLPLTEHQEAYAQQVHAALHAHDVYVDVIGHGKTLNKRIRDAQLAGYNYIVVVGEKEAATNEVNVRTRDGNAVLGTSSVDSFVEKILSEVAAFQ